MSDAVSACENVCNDFASVTTAMDAVLRLVPWVALIWGIIAFFKKRRDERHALDLAERRKVYLELVEAVHSLRRKHVRNEDSEMWDYYMILDKIKFMFPTELPESLTEHEHAIRYFCRCEGVDDIFDAMRSAEEIAFSRLLLDLRRDLEIPVNGEKQ